MAHQLESPMNLQSNKARVVYLVRYSQADMSIVPNRRKFADSVAGKFNRGSQHNRVLYQVFSREKHCNSGSHFHSDLKLDGVLRWAGVKNRVTTSYGIVLLLRLYVCEQERSSILPERESPCRNRVTLNSTIE